MCWPLMFLSCCLMSYLPGIENVVYDNSKHTFSIFQNISSPIDNLRACLRRWLNQRTSTNPYVQSMLATASKVGLLNKNPTAEGKNQNSVYLAANSLISGEPTILKIKYSFAVWSEFAPFSLTGIPNEMTGCSHHSYCQLVFSLSHCYRMFSAIPSECT